MGNSSIVVIVVRFHAIQNSFSFSLGIKETESGKYPMKGYLAVREGDILCIPRESNTTAKHMADLVRNDLFFLFT